MAVHVSNDPQLLRRAVVASVLLHLLLAFFLPNWMRAESAGLQPVETLTFARLVRLEIRQPTSHAPPRAILTAAKAAPVVTTRRVRSELSAPSKRQKTVPKPVSGEAAPRAAAQKSVHEQTQPVYARATVPPAPVSDTRENAPASPQPDVAQGERPAGGSSDRGGVMPFGAEQDPVLDPHVLSLLQQKVGVHVTLVVLVGEDGKTQHVSFDPPIDAATERSIEAILADATWDAAVCGGGVSCSGTATIKL